MSVTIAVQVYGSETLVALIRHFRRTPGTQAEAARALNLHARWISENLPLLIEVGVITREDVPGDKRKGHYVVDEERAKQLLDTLRDYVLID